MHFLLDLLKIDQIQALENVISEKKAQLLKPGYQHYHDVLTRLPELRATTNHFYEEAVKIGLSADLSAADLGSVLGMAKELIPWRKGPFELFGERLEAEWRSNLKWERLVNQLPSLTGKTLLDIGANSGYYMFRMLAHSPKAVLGIDPTVHFYSQFKFLNHFAQCPELFYEMLGIEHLPLFPKVFDGIFSMGILYHHRHPIKQLQDIYESLRPGGFTVIETIGIPGEQSLCLFPESTYAKMKNVWFVPTKSCLYNWLKRTHFKDITLISETQTTIEEQRLTPWCPPPHQSLQDFLNPKNRDFTVEGYQAPRRFAFLAFKK